MYSQVCSPGGVRGNTPMARPQPPHGELESRCPRFLALPWHGSPSVVLQGISWLQGFGVQSTCRRGNALTHPSVQHLQPQGSAHWARLQSASPCRGRFRPRGPEGLLFLSFQSFPLGLPLGSGYEHTLPSAASLPALLGTMSFCPCECPAVLSPHSHGPLIGP